MWGSQSWLRRTFPGPALAGLKAGCRQNCLPHAYDLTSLLCQHLPIRILVHVFNPEFVVAESAVDHRCRQEDSIALQFIINARFIANFFMLLATRDSQRDSKRHEIRIANPQFA